MVKPELIRRKLSILHGYLAELERHRHIAFETYVTGGDARRAIERLLQLVVDVAVDINSHIVTETEGIPPTDYGSSFSAAGRSGAIPADLAERLRPSAGLRNALVHEYGDIEDAKVHAAIPQALDGYRAYAQAIHRWLGTNQ